MTIGVGPGARDGSLEALERTAERHMAEGRLEESARVWEQVLVIAPEHPKALLHLGQHRLYRKDAAGARVLLERAAMADPRNPAIPLNLSFAFRALSDMQREEGAIARALAIDPLFLPALLSKATFFERTGKTKLAAKTYEDVLKIAPPDDRLEQWMIKPLQAAREAVRRNREQLDAYLEGRLQPIKASHRGAELTRFEESKEIMTGARTAFVQQPTMLHYPELPPVQFYDTGMFPWLAEVESQTEVIRDELTGLLREDQGGFEPYVNHPEGVPLKQEVAVLNRSPKWSAYFLWSDGKKVDAHAARCPRTAAILEKVPKAVVPGAAPSAFFSALAPRTLIPPHTGVTNTRLIVHIPLVVPEGCWFRVGNQKREWVPGRALVFDDTIEHEAWNGSEKPRYILIFDIWNPNLSEAERALVCELISGVQDYYKR